MDLATLCFVFVSALDIFGVPMQRYKNHQGTSEFTVYEVEESSSVFLLAPDDTGLGHRKQPSSASEIRSLRLGSVLLL